jgi:hypothetical protein
VGRPRLSPAQLRVRAGEVVRLRLRERHPTQPAQPAPRRAATDRSLAGRRLRLEVEAGDRRGDRQVVRRVASIRVVTSA